MHLNNEERYVCKVVKQGSQETGFNDNKKNRLNDIVFLVSDNLDMSFTIYAEGKILIL